MVVHVLVDGCKALLSIFGSVLFFCHLVAFIFSVVCVLTSFTLRSDQPICATPGYCCQIRCTRRSTGQVCVCVGGWVGGGYSSSL